MFLQTIDVRSQIHRLSKSVAMYVSFIAHPHHAAIESPLLSQGSWHGLACYIVLRVTRGVENEIDARIVLYAR